MIAKQKAEAEKKANASKNDPVPTSDSVDSGAAGVAPAAAKLKFGIKKAGVTTPKGETNGTGTKVSTPSQTVHPDSGSDTIVDSPSRADAGIFSLDDLASSESEGEESAPREPTTGRYFFADEIPSTAPTRELPDDLTESQQAFVHSLNSIYEIVHDPELFGQVIRQIMQELQENPDYTKIMADQDVHTMLRGLRQSMGLAKIKKAEKATKTRAGSKAAPKAAALAGTADAMFNDSDW